MTTTLDSYVICAPKNNSASSASPSATQAQNDAQTSTQSSNTGLAVASENPSCQANCSSSNDTCCGCCSSPSNCDGNDISRRCCPANSGFCGCISNRAFCSGSVYNSTYGSVSGYDSFGACFDASTGATCTYNPNPNLWIVCPKDYNACESASFFSCCSPDTVCTTTAADSYPICAPKSSSTVAPSSTNAPPATTRATQGTFVAPTPAEGSTLTVGQTFTVTYQSPTSQTGVVYILMVGGVVVSDGAFSSNPLTITATVPNIPSGPANISLIEEYNQFGPFASYNIVTRRQVNIQQAAQSTTGNTGGDTPVQGSCPSGLYQCGDACYQTSQYCCKSGQLTQIAFCSATPASSNGASSGSPTPSSTPSSGNTGGDAPVQGSCPSGLYQCGDACYQTSQYCCKSGQLTQIAFCSATPASSNGASSANPAPSTGNSGSDTCQSASYCGAGLCACSGACYTQDQYCCKNNQLTQKAFC